MNSHFRAFSASLLFAASLLVFSAQSSAKDASYSNPVIAGDYPDPSVIRVGRDYWATATTSEWAPLFPILHSRDLVNWEHVGNVFTARPEWARANFWAPEIIHYKDTYYIYYVGRKKGGPLSIAVATASKPTGPFVDHGPMVSQPAGSIDPFPVSDENGERYLVWKEDGNSRNLPTPIWAQKLSDDGTRLVGEMKELIRNDFPWEGRVVEGPYIQRHDGWFYLFYSGSACCGRECSYALGVARSKTLLGPWEKNAANPILAGNDTWKCPGHGSIVSDSQGRDFLLYHAYQAHDFVYVGREALLDQVLWGADGWPTINERKGPSVLAAAPLKTASHHKEQTFVDDFKSSTLKPQWQWPQNNEPIRHIARGWLELAPAAGHSNDLHSAVIAVKTASGSYKATTVVDTESLGEGIMAGISAYGDSQNALGLSIDGTKATLWVIKKGGRELNTFEYPKSRRTFLRLTAKDGHLFKFSASADGVDWKPIGKDIDIEGYYLPPWDRGIRVALTTGTLDTGKQIPVKARFDSLRLEPIDLH